MKISELLLKYQTDKNYGTVVPSLGHCYGESYDKLFDKFDKNVELNFLEIGVQKGGSMCAWKDFFKNANVYGVDITDEILDEYRREDITYIISDIKNPIIKEKFKDIKFDIIIDDGSHRLFDVLYVVSEFLELLNDGGILIVEDCQNPEEWVREISNRLDSNYKLSFEDLRNVNRHYDDFLIVIEKIKNL